MADTFPNIDYSDLIADLGDDMESGYIDEQSKLYLVRQLSAINVECCGKQMRPVIDYFYDKPELNMTLTCVTVNEAKKVCFAALEKIDNEAMKANVELLTQDLKDYTAGNNKRNEKLCSLLFEKENNIPMMVYYEDSDAASEVECITAGELMSELKEAMG